MSNSKYTAILKGLHNAIALDYHYNKSLIFWSDVSIGVIRSAYINGSNVRGKQAATYYFYMKSHKNICRCHEMGFANSNRRSNRLDP